MSIVCEKYSLMVSRRRCWNAFCVSRGLLFVVLQCIQQMDVGEMEIVKNKKRLCCVSFERLSWPNTEMNELNQPKMNNLSPFEWERLRPKRIFYFWIKTQKFFIVDGHGSIHNKKKKSCQWPNWRQTLIVSFTPRHLTSNWVEMEWARGKVER